MAGKFREAAENSRLDFKRHVEPILKSHWRDCEIFSAEQQQDPILKILDESAGIDYLVSRKDSLQSYGLASRIQRAGMNYRTFTVRSKRDSGTPTEYEKRRKAIHGGWLYPTMTQQTYLTADGERLYAMALILTVDLFTYLEKRVAKTNHTNATQHGQAEFFIVRWEDLFEVCNLMIFEPADDGWQMTYLNKAGEKTTRLLRRNAQ